MVRLTTVLLALTMVLTACGGDPSGNTTRLNRGLEGEPTTLDPHFNTTVQGRRVLVDLYEGLLRYSAEGELEGGVARDWSVSADGLTYTFLFHDDAHWSNGDRLTAYDFEFAFRRLVDRETAAVNAKRFPMIANSSAILVGALGPSSLGVEARDAVTLIIRLEQPTPFFLQLLAHPAASPLHRASLTKHSKSTSQPGVLVSNGAYQLQEIVTGSSITLVKNPHYREHGAVTIDEVVYHIVIDESVAYNRYRAGELDILANVPSASFTTIANDRPAELKVSPMFGVYYYGFNLTRRPFKNNTKLRQALSLAIDRDALAEKVLGRGEVPAYSWVPPGVDGYRRANLALSDRPFEERVRRAQSLYAEAGYSAANPARFELRYNVGEGQDRIAAALQSMWRMNLGAEASLINEEFKVLLDNVRSKQKTEMFRLSWVGDYVDPHTFLELALTGHEQNMTGYSNPTFDSLVQRAVAEPDPDARFRLLHDAEQLLLDDYAVIPLYFYVNKYLVSPRVLGWHNRTYPYHASRFLSLVQ